VHVASVGMPEPMSRNCRDLLSPWQGFGVLCIWTVLALAVAAYLLERRDA
jgi:ABC-type transport system involved in multi-copper enzyme maturation permease subunit